MPRTRSLLLTALVSLGVAGPASSAVMPRQWFLSAGGGGIFGVTRTDNVFEGYYVDTVGPGGMGATTTDAQARYGTRSAVSGQVLYHLTAHSGMGVEVLYSHFETQTHDTVDVTDFTQTSVLALGRYVFLPERDWTPYLIGKGGISRISFTTARDPDACHDRYPASNFRCYEYSRDVNASLLTGSAGIGLEGTLRSGFFVGLELGAIRMIGKGSVGIRSSTLPYVEARAGLKFGGRGL